MILVKGLPDAGARPRGHGGEGAGEQRPPGPDGVDAGLAGGQVVQPGAVLAFAESGLDAGPPPEPGFQAGDVTFVGGDVGDDEAVGVGVLRGAVQRQRELVFGDRPAPPGPRVAADPFGAELDPAHDRAAVGGPAGRA